MLNAITPLFLRSVLSILLGMVIVPVSYARFFYKQPSSIIVSIANKAYFSENGREIFYKTEPALLEKREFASACNRHEGVSSLGCFDGQNIKLFEIRESRLEGMIPVTAAHEMLHAAYEQMNKNERKRIDVLLSSIVATLKDPDIQAKIDAYKKGDADVLPSEYHSILGTEMENLPAELETHYAKYFSNRKSLVALARSYYDELNSRKKVLKISDDQLDKMRTDIDLRIKILKTKQSHLSVLKKQLEASDSPPARENVESYNRLVEEFNIEAKSLEQMTTEFNRLAKDRNLKAVESKRLYEAMDSAI